MKTVATITLIIAIIYVFAFAGYSVYRRWIQKETKKEEPVPRYFHPLLFGLAVVLAIVSLIVYYA